MFNHQIEKIDWCGKELILETGKIARQADGAVMATMGETTVLCTAVAQRHVKPGIDFFPLTIAYQEKAFAAGKIPGGFFKREGRPNESEVLTSRLIDRPIRPLFPDGFKNEVQVICTVLSHDMENPADIVAMVGASAALAISGVPFQGPLGGARVSYKEGQFSVNPTLAELEKADLDLVVAGTKDGVLMVESEAKELTEDTMLQAVNIGHDACKQVIEAIDRLVSKVGNPVWELADSDLALVALKHQIAEIGRDALTAAYAITLKQDRHNALSEAREMILTKMTDSDLEVNLDVVGSLTKKLEAQIVRGQILDSGSRIDGRDTKTVRPITCEVGILPRAHGSALFTRGETQALVVLTLGTSQDEQIVDALTGEYRQNFMLHYNFPPYSVGETGRLGSPGRREIGHGKLAWRAMNPMLPGKENFPYTMRAVSEITESNGSSSMATVCGTSLAIMDAGVPMPRPVAGIAMGLIKEEDRFAVLTDILGDEDHLGDMDFKVAGTSEGVTALQMDIKIASITSEIMQIALEQAKQGRLHILTKMSEALSTAREGVNENAPQITTLQINKNKIRDVIGSGGKVIREICEVTGAKIDIEDDGTVRIAAISGEIAQKARAWIQEIVAEPEIGMIYDGKVVKTVDFGAFVNFLGSRDGLVHISELTEGRVNRVTDVIKNGDSVKVKVVGFDDRGKVKLSMRHVNQETGEDIFR